MAKTEKKTRNPKPKSQTLKGMEDSKIPELETHARKYAEARDQRLEWGAVETKEQDILLGLMKKHGKKTYRHAKLELKVVVEKEKVKVRVIGDED